jgi:hypothetical protein
LVSFLPAKQSATHIRELGAITLREAAGTPQWERQKAPIKLRAFAGVSEAREASASIPQTINTRMPSSDLLMARQLNTFPPEHCAKGRSRARAAKAASISRTGKLYVSSLASHFNRKDP